MGFQISDDGAIKYALIYCNPEAAKRFYEEEVQSSVHEDCLIWPMQASFLAGMPPHQRVVSSLWKDKFEVASFIKEERKEAKT